MKPKRTQNNTPNQKDNATKEINTDKGRTEQTKRKRHKATPKAKQKQTTTK